MMMLDVVIYNSVQDYYDYKDYNFIYPKHFNLCNVNASPRLYYSTEYGEEYENNEGYYEFADTVQNDRTEFFFSNCNGMCRIMVCLINSM